MVSLTIVVTMTLIGVSEAFPLHHDLSMISLGFPQDCMLSSNPILPASSSFLKQYLPLNSKSSTALPTSQLSLQHQSSLFSCHQFNFHRRSVSRLEAVTDNMKSAEMVSQGMEGDISSVTKTGNVTPIYDKDSRVRPKLAEPVGFEETLPLPSQGIDKNEDFLDQPRTNGGKHTEDQSAHSEESPNDVPRRRPSVPSLTITAIQGAVITSVSPGIILSENKPVSTRCDSEVNEGELTNDENSDEDKFNNENVDEKYEESNNSADGITLARRALLRRASLANRNVKKSSRSKGRASLAKTHVNKSKRGSSTSKGGGAVGRVLTTVRTAAAAATTATPPSSGGIPNLTQVKKEKQTSNDREGDNNDPQASYSATNAPVTASPSSKDWKSVVQSTVAELVGGLGQIDHNAKNSLHFPSKITPNRKTPNFEKDDEFSSSLLPPGITLINKRNLNTQAYPPQSQITVRSSIPHSSDDKYIANLRLAVFSKFDEEMQRQFRSRSLQVLNVRRKRGAVALIAETPDWRKDERNRGEDDWVRRDAPSSITWDDFKDISIDNQENVRPRPNIIKTAVGSSDHQLADVPRESSTACKQRIIGTVECSNHEFHGTMLGNARPKGSLMYVTEVAVNPEVRRRGTGAMLMKSVDEVAALCGVESIYLHVDVTNHAACAMYEKAGYRCLDKRDPIYAQFTASLNLHDGAMHGRKHHLMCKNTTGKTTWLDDGEDFLFLGSRDGESLDLL